MKLKKKAKKLLASFWVTVFIGITLSWFVWKTWDKFDELVGGGNTAYFIAGGIIILLIVLGHFSFKKLAKRFT